MKSTNYRLGYRAERAAVKQLEEEGYTAARTAGSHSPFDVVAFRKSGARFIQVKSSRKFSNSIIDNAMKPLWEISREMPEGCSAELWVKVNRKPFMKYKIRGGLRLVKLE